MPARRSGEAKTTARARPRTEAANLRELRLETNEPTDGHPTQDPVRRIDLETTEGEVEPPGRVVMVVLEELATAQEVEREEIPRQVPGAEVPIAVAVAAPVDDRALGRADHPVERQQEELPPRSREPEVEHRDHGAPHDAARPRRGDLLERGPLGV